MVLIQMLTVLVYTTVPQASQYLSAESHCKPKYTPEHGSYTVNNCE